MMGGGGETVEARPGHSGGLGKPGGDEYIQAVWETTKNIRSGYLTSHIPTYLPTYLFIYLQSHLNLNLHLHW